MRHTAMLIVTLALFAGGCASYRTPGGGADLSGIREHDVREAFAREAGAQFPAQVAVARVQSPGYFNRYNEGYGQGRYSVVTTRDVESDADVRRLGALPQVAGLAPLNRLVLPTQLDSISDLRRAAAQVRADMLLVYTLDTSFRVKGKDIAPLRTFSLGVISSDDTRVLTTASAMLVDVRTGYVYGLAESTARREKSTNAWTSGLVVDEFRKQTEAEAFGKLVDELAALWPRIVAEHAASAPRAATR